jgi:hypothetical protein
MHTSLVRRTLFIFGVMSLVLVVINLLTDRGTFWAIWPIWAFSMIAGAAVGAGLLRGHFFLGLWLGGGLFLIPGLIGINISEGGSWWFLWPLGAWILISLLLIGLGVDILSTIPTSRPATEDDDL